MTVRLVADGTSIATDELDARARRIATLLGELGLRRHDRVGLLLDPGPWLHPCAVGAQLAGGVLVPLFTSYGPDAVARRLRAGRVRFLVTTGRQHEAKVAPHLESLTDLDVSLLAGSSGPVPRRTASLDLLLNGVGRAVRPDPPSDDDPATLHFTSGTTGDPKGVLHAHRAADAQVATARTALDLHARDVFWCTAQPGWVTATAYGIVAPLAIGATVVVDEARFDPRRFYEVVETQRVTVVYTSPTLVRFLRRAGDDLARDHDLSSLRVVATVGEPLDPDAVEWGERVLGTPILDGWWQTETGAITIANLPGGEVTAGSMGRPLPGVEAAVAWHNPHGDARISAEGLELVEEGVAGELVLRAGAPAMFTGYLDDDQHTGAAYAAGWYRTHDLVRRDDAGRFWVCGRADDAISSAGHLVGPVEVERVLRSHPAVGDVAVVGRPDRLAGEVVHAVVVPAAGAAATDALALDLVAHARRRLGPALAPRTVSFAHELPLNASGKVVRRLLRERLDAA